MNKLNTTASTTFAKILTEGDIEVVFDNVSTASISLDMKTVTIPNYVDGLSRCVIEQYILHEAAGHGVMTPQDIVWEGLTFKIDKLCKHLNIKFNLVNLVEDERIERLLKEKYNGCDSIFNASYNELYFKELKFIDNPHKVNSTTFLTKLNIFYKVGVLAGVEFNEEELYFVNKIRQNKTFIDVINSVIALTKYLNDKKSEKQNNKENSTSGETTDNKPNAGAADNNEREESNNYESNEKTANKVDEEYYSEEINDPIENIKDINYRNGFSNPIKIKKLTKEQADSVIMSDKEFDLHVNRFIFELKDPYNVIKDVASYINKISKKSSIAMSAKFNIHKSATNSQLINISSSGEINDDVLFDYKTSNNIFLDSKTTKNGKKHGFVVYLDFSGSMGFNDVSKTNINIPNILLDILCRNKTLTYQQAEGLYSSKLYKGLVQLCTLYHFCSRENIPFKSYTYSSHVSHDFATNTLFTAQPMFNSNKSTKHNLDILKLIIDVIISESVNKLLGKFQTSIKVKNPNNSSYSIHYFLSLGGTFTADFIFHNILNLKEFKKNNNIEKLNIINITDGASSKNTINETLREYLFSQQQYPSKYKRKHTSVYDENSKQYIQDLSNIADCNSSVPSLILLKANIECTYSEFTIFSDINDFMLLNNLLNTYSVDSGVLKNTVIYSVQRSLLIKEYKKIIRKNCHLKVEDKYHNPIIDNQFMYFVGNKDLKTNNDITINNTLKQLSNINKSNKALELVNNLMIELIV